MKQKIITLLFAVVASTASIYATSYFGSCGENLHWGLNTSTRHLSITGFGPMEDYVHTYGGPWHEHFDSLETITMQEGITHIGDIAFAWCHLVESIDIPNTVTSIGQQAFRACDSLYSITIPNSVTELGKNAFSYCSHLTSINLSENITIINNETFSSCNALKSIILPNGVTEIGTCAFCGCMSLSFISIPNSVTKIGNSAFFSCNSFKTITIPENVTSIGQKAFSGCTSLDTVYNYAKIPQRIDGDVFSGLDRSKCHLIVPKESIELYKAANGWKDFIISNGTQTPQEEAITVRLDPQSALEWTTVRLWAWTDNGNIFDAWPGQIINQKDGWYSYTFDSSIRSVNIIWTNGIDQTIDIQDITESKCYELNSTTGMNITVSIVDCVEIPTAIDEIQSNNANCTKILRNNQILILRGDKIYTLQGQEVK